jgi:hypothetical protein
MQGFSPGKFVTGMASIVHKHRTIDL